MGRSQKLPDVEVRDLVVASLGAQRKNKSGRNLSQREFYSTALMVSLSILGPESAIKNERRTDHEGKGAGRRKDLSHGGRCKGTPSSAHKSASLALVRMSSGGGRRRVHQQRRHVWSRFRLKLLVSCLSVLHRTHQLGISERRAAWLSSGPDRKRALGR